jgi:hypothetical protein
MREMMNNLQESQKATFKHAVAVRCEQQAILRVIRNRVYYIFFILASGFGNTANVLNRAYRVSEDRANDTKVHLISLGTWN